MKHAVKRCCLVTLIVHSINAYTSVLTAAADAAPVVTARSRRLAHIATDKAIRSNSV
jgi:hypothetical protein